MVFVAAGVVGTGVVAWMLSGEADAQPEKKPAAPAAPTAKQPEAVPPADPMMEAFLKAAEPVEQHAGLARFAGTWNAHVKHWMEPGATPVEETGTMVNTMVLGGRFLKSEFSGQMMDMEFRGLGTWGYNTITQRFESSWHDTFGTGILFMSGSVDAAGTVYTSTGEMDMPMGMGRLKQREVLTFVNADTHVMEFFSPDPAQDGKEVRMMEITYTRKK